MPDKYSAIWVSHSSMGDFLKCPRLYYLKNIYKDPVTKRKMNIVAPALSLGVAVHEVLEGLGDFPSGTRMDRDLLTWFNDVWKKFSGERGGFVSGEQEQEYKLRGIAMLQNVTGDSKFLVNKCIKLPRGEMNPHFYLDEKENIILNGLIDWIEYIPESDSLHIVDFKTGKYEEGEGSLQLPIYLLICNALQKRVVTKASYWYLESDKIIEKDLPDAKQARIDVLELAMKVKDARMTQIFLCPQGANGCIHCGVFEKILKRDSTVTHVGIGGFNQDLYLVKKYE